MNAPAKKSDYTEYRSHPNLQQLVGEIPWGQNILILQMVKEGASVRGMDPRASEIITPRDKPRGILKLKELKEGRTQG